MRNSFDHFPTFLVLILIYHIFIFIILYYLIYCLSQQLKWYKAMQSEFWEERHHISSHCCNISSSRLILFLYCPIKLVFSLLASWTYLHLAIFFLHKWTHKSEERMNSLFKNRDFRLHWKGREDILGIKIFRAVAPLLQLLQLPSAGLTPLFSSCPSASSCPFLLIPFGCLIHYFSHSVALPFHLIYVASPTPGWTTLHLLPACLWAAEQCWRQSPHPETENSWSLFNWDTNIIWQSLPFSGSHSSHK